MEVISRGIKSDLVQNLAQISLEHTSTVPEVLRDVGGAGLGDVQSGETKREQTDLQHQT